MRKVFAILDIETITNARLAFDIAWIVYDSKGNELERYNALVSEIVDMPYGIALISHDDFMKNKAAFYRNMITFDSIPVKSFNEIADDFAMISQRYNAHTVMCAYNAKFDYSVLNANANMYYGRNFFNANIEVVDIMTMALATICNTNKYVRWCNVNEFVTEKGNVKTSAESVYAYLIRDTEFVEAHHALQDCEIEADIYFKARKYRKKHHKHFAMPVFHCKEWQQVQARNH
jgi:DNA polymerase III epsilon subunit-like protein